MKTIERKYERVKGELVVLVDIGKREHYAALHVKDAGVIARKRFSNDLAGFQQVSDEVDAVCRRHLFTPKG